MKESSLVYHVQRDYNGDWRVAEREVSNFQSTGWKLEKFVTTDARTREYHFTRNESEFDFPMRY